MKTFLKRSWHWIVLFLLTDAVFIFVTWIIRREAMKYMALFIFLFTVLTCIVGVWAESRRQKKEEAALLRFLEAPDDRTKSELIQKFGSSEALEVFCAYITEQSAQVNDKAVELAAYREYIEAWVHEIKTPLSLSTLVLNNHQDEMSPYVFARMSYIQHQVNEDVARILFYARLQSDHSDYKFTRFRLDECVREVLAEYQTFTEEKNVQVQLDLNALAVISDRKVVSFMLSQLIDNAIKYADNIEGKIALSMDQKSDKITFHIYNNGEGVPTEDAPFVFDKGFTGNHPNRQKATGMGLYLVRKYAENLNVDVQLDSEGPFGNGFGIQLIFTL